MNIGFLNELFSTITQRDARNRRRSARLSDDGYAGLVEDCRELEASDGEASSIALARRLLDRYERLGSEDRLRFFRVLADEYSPDPEVIHRAYALYSEQQSGENLQGLFDACEPPRQELLRRLNLPPGGTYDLVRMRADLLGLLPDHPDLGAVDHDFVHLFSSWFNRGFLVLRRIDWNTPAAILERIIDYEAVHEIRDWSDLRRRLAPGDRRCFAFFHPAIGDEPLIFVEVALRRGLPDRIQHIIEGGEELLIGAEEADTAAFYGISDCQKGLRGISFGNFLIKQVVQELTRELPNLEYFVTLSPVPGLAGWLASERDDPNSPLDDATRKALGALETTDWPGRPDEALRNAVLQQAARYLTSARNRKNLPQNPVARFHLGNGARLHRLNWLGDVSEKGLSQGAGLMVNYLYVLDEIESNHERYATEGTVAASGEVRKLARQAGKRIKAEESS